MQSHKQLEIPDNYPRDAMSYLQDKYDFIVVGASTNGAAMASLLNEKAERNFPLVEAGVHQPLTSELYPVWVLFRSITGVSPTIISVVTPRCHNRDPVRKLL